VLVTTSNMRPPPAASLFNVERRIAVEKLLNTLGADLKAGIAWVNGRHGSPNRG
jgi:hypothetical protein